MNNTTCAWCSEKKPLKFECVSCGARFCCEEEAKRHFRYITLVEPTADEIKEINA